MWNRDQSQSATEGGTAIQAGGNVTFGLSYSDVRQVALDVFRGNFYQLAGIARDTATARAEEITENFLRKLEKENPAGLLKANDPDFQYALLTAQKEYARTGDADLGDLLVDLLVDRSMQEQRDILQIVLNESLKTAPKLTSDQLAALAIIFIFRYTQNYHVVSHKTLGEYFDKHIPPFASKVVKNMTCYQHLEFAGCGTVGLAGQHLGALLGMNYQGLFMKGFDKEIVTERGVSIGVDGRFFTPCLNNPKKIQIVFTTRTVLDQAFDAHDISVDDRERISSLFELGKMDDDEIKAKCVEIRPFMAEIFDKWDNSALMRFALTSVGLAIGHANVTRQFGKFTNLSAWIN